jgi:hypothetical protein
MTLINHLADLILIVGAVGGEGSDGSAIWSSRASAIAALSISLLVTATATI